MGADRHCAAALSNAEGEAEISPDPPISQITDNPVEGHSRTQNYSMTILREITR